MFLSLFTLAFANPEYEIGIEALRNKEYAKAQVHLSNCIQKEPQNTTCYWELGWAYWMQGNWSSVVQSWKKVQELDPNYPELKTYLPQAADQAWSAAMQFLVDQPSGNSRLVSSSASTS